MPKAVPEYLKTGIPGFDELLDHGIPRGYSLLIAGGPGTGKTIFCLQTAYNLSQQGEKTLYMFFEKTEEALSSHMGGFGWNQ